MSKRTSFIATIAATVVAAFATDACAQGTAQAEVVVPTINVFSVGTTVSVPDRGGTLLGGLNSAAERRAEGPGGGRGFASSRRSGNATVNVWIHDLHEQDEMIESRRDVASKPASGFAAGLQSYASSRASGGSAKSSVTASAATSNSSGASSENGSVASSGNFAKADAAKADRATGLALDKDGRESQAADYLNRGDDAASRVKTTVAKLYFQMAAKLGPAPSAAEASKRLLALEVQVAKK